MDLLISGLSDACMTTSNLSPADEMIQSTVNGSTGYPSVAITVKL